MVSTVGHRGSSNVAAWNAYVNEPSRLPDGGMRAGKDDVEPIETSRPDTRKVEGEEPDNRHRASHAPGSPIVPPVRVLQTRKEVRVLRVHLRDDRLPPAGHLNLPMEPQVPSDFTWAPDRADVSAIIARYVIDKTATCEFFEAENHWIA